MESRTWAGARVLHRRHPGPALKTRPMGKYLRNSLISCGVAAAVIIWVPLQAA